MNLERWRQIDRIFQAVIEVGGEEREALLDKLCRDDADLRSEVESLLEHERKSLTLLDRVGEIVSSATVPIQPGDRLGNWRIGPVLGEGGSSVVFEGERVDRRYERRVAVKVLHHALLTAHALERFHRECQVLAGLDHPAIARLEDAGSTEHGLPYIVLERVEGERLDVWCRQAQPSLDERLELFERVCSAVAFAHRNLVVHRDLKPSNVLVTAEGDPKLLDFGIARVLSGGRQDWTRLTRTVMPMTPQYASPEQLRGGDVSTASDVYSLGLLLYELLTGRLPYKLGDLTDEAARKLTTGSLNVPLPSVAVTAENASPALAAGTLRGDLDTIVLTALEPSIERRYPTAQALADEIDRVRRGLPILARAPSAGYVLRRFVGRHSLGVAASLAGLLLTIAFAVTMAVSASRLEIQRERATREAATAQEVVAFLGGLFEGAEPAVHQGRDLTARELLDRGAADLERRTLEDTSTQAALDSAIGKAYLELSAFPEARIFLERSLALRTDSDLPEGQVESQLLLARLDLAETEFEDSAGHARAALRLLENLPRQDSAEGQGRALEATVLLGRALMALGDLDDGEAKMRVVMEAVGSEPSGTQTEFAGIAHLELGGALMKRGHWQEARPYLERARELLVSAHGELHPEVFEAERTTYYLEAILDESLGAANPEQLLGLLERQKQLYGDAHEQMMWTLTDLATAYTALHRDDLGERTYREALTMQEALVADDHLVLAIIHAGLGHIARRGEDFDSAVRHFERSFEIALQSFAADSIDMAYPKMTLGHALSRVGRCAEGEPLLAAAHQAFDRARPATDFNRVESLWGWGHALACSGDPRGEAMMREALAIADTADWKDNDGLRQDIEMWRRLTAEQTGMSVAKESPQRDRAPS